MASTAKAYPNSDARESGNVAIFSLVDLVKSCDLPSHYRSLLLRMLEKNRFGTELFRSTAKLASELCVSYSTAKRMIDRLEQGWRDYGPVLALVYEANSRPGGKLRRQRTYRLDAANLRRRPTDQERNHSRRGSLCPLRPKPPQPEAPPRERPAAHVQGEGISRAEDRAQKLRAELVNRVEKYQRGFSGQMQSPEGGLGRYVGPGDPRYVKPLPGQAGILAACTSMIKGDDKFSFESRGLTMNQALQLAKEAGFDWISPGEHGP